MKAKENSILLLSTDNSQNGNPFRCLMSEIFATKYLITKQTFFNFVKKKN